MKRILHSLLMALLLTAGLPTAAAIRLPWHRKKAKPDVTAVPGKTIPAPRITPERKASTPRDEGDVISQPGPIPFGSPTQTSLTKAESSRIDLRALPQTPQPVTERPEREEPRINRTTIQGTVATPRQSTPSVPTPEAPAPPTIMNFDGLDFANFGSGHPPDTNGDAGPTYYIQTVNTSIGIFRKSDGVRVAGFSFNTFMSQGHFGNLCDTDNFGDPVVLYDSFEDRWIITDFAFQLSGNNVVNPPGNFQCFAASMSGDPVSGGWNFYSINTAGGLGDYPKFGIWPDGLYMSVNMFDYAGNGNFQNSRVYALNKAQMYAGKPSVQVVTFNAPVDDFTILPSNARLQAGAPPLGAPNYFLSTWEFTNSLTIYKFHVDWTHPTASTFTGPDVPIAATSWPNTDVPNAPSQGGSALDVLEIRAMVQNQYTNLGGVESLWASHTVRRSDASDDPNHNVFNGFAAPRWYQVDVTGGSVNANLPQAATWDPDGANVIYRFMPSVAVDRAGDMALGYSTSSTTTKPALKYAGRLSTDPPNTLSQTERVLLQGAGTQTSGSRWGDYSAMTLDPDGCTFWYTNEYYATNGVNWQTRVGSFAFPSCTAVGAGGTISGTVTAAVGGAPISGAVVTLGSRTTTTNGSGLYSFLSIPAGTYPSITVTDPGYNSASASSIVVTDGNTTMQNFALTLAPTNACPSDTTQSDFQTGVPSNVDLSTSPGDVVLANPAIVDQQNTTLGDANGVSGGVITSTAFGGQTFTPAVTAPLHAVDINLFCSNCTGTTPNLTVSVRATSGGLPTGPDIASAAIPGFNNGSTAFYTATFSSAPMLTAGTMYAIVVRPIADPSAGVYALSRSGGSSAGSDVYAGGTRVADSASGTSWSIPLTGGITTDAGFRTYMQTGYVTSGDLVSSARDSNPAPGLTSLWSTLSWTATTPAQTSLKFQAAGSNSADGPFNFVGPDGTSATFFTASGASLSQFNGLRYVEYRAYLASTNTAVTPTVNDVTICYAVADCSAPAPITPSAALACPSSTGNAASGPAGASSYSWSITNGTITGGASAQTVTYTAGASGNVGLTLNIVETVGCHKSGSINVPIAATPTITPGGPTTFCAGGSVTLTSSAAAGNQWLLNGNPIGGATNQTFVATTAGNYSVTGNGCTGFPSTQTAVTVNALPSTPSITISNVQTVTQSGPSGTFTLGFNGQTTSSLAFNASAAAVQSQLNALSSIGGAGGSVAVSLSGSVYTVTFSGTLTGPQPQITAAVAGGAVVTVNASAVCGGSAGNQAGGPGGATTYAWSVTNGTITSATNIQTINYTAGASGTVVLNLTVTNAAGCGAASAPANVPVNPSPPTPTITPGGPTTFCTGGSVTLTSSSAAANQWSLNGNPIGGATNQAYLATASGNYTVTVTGGNACTSTSTVTAVLVNPIPATPTITPGGPTTFCTGGSVTLTSSSAAGNQWSLNGSAIGGATNQAYIASATGNYTVTVTAGGCSSAASSITAVTVNPAPAVPTITPGGPTTFCAGGSVTLTSSAASGNQWSLNGNPIGGATNQAFSATAAGNYIVTVTGGNGCTSASSATTVTVNPVPAAPAISGATSFCTGGSTTLTSTSASGNQWSLNGNPIGGATNQTFNATAAGNYTVTVTASGCSSAASAITTITVNPIPATPTITPGGPTTFCAGGSVTLTSSSASGNQWYLNSNPIGGAANATFIATAAGSYSVTVTAAGCMSAMSAATNVTINPNPNATITAVSTMVTGTSTTASVADAGAGAAYLWTISGGTITAGAGTRSITFAAGPVGTLNLTAKVTSASGCIDTKAANIAVTAPPVTVTSILPVNGSAAGGTAVTINGTGFASGAHVTIGGTAATNVVVVNATRITAKSPAHAAATVNVTVTNADTSSGTLTNGYVFLAHQFDPNGDSRIDIADIFYLINHFFFGGPPSQGVAGPVLSGDANGDGVADLADIFYLINYLFMHGPAPFSVPSAGHISATAIKSSAGIAGEVTLGKAQLRGGRYFIPVIVTATPGSAAVQALSLNVQFSGGDGALDKVSIQRAGVARDLQPAFETSNQSGNGLYYLVSYNSLNLGSDGRPSVVAEIQISGDAAGVTISVDHRLTMLSNQSGTRSATVANGLLRVSGTTIDSAPRTRPSPLRNE
jgi:hypothetical protein